MFKFFRTDQENESQDTGKTFETSDNAPKFFESISGTLLKSFGENSKEQNKTVGRFSTNSESPGSTDTQEHKSSLGAYFPRLKDDLDKDQSVQDIQAEGIKGRLTSFKQWILSCLPDRGSTLFVVTAASLLALNYYVWYHFQRKYQQKNKTLVIKSENQKKEKTSN